MTDGGKSRQFTETGDPVIIHGMTGKGRCSMAFDQVLHLKKTISVVLVLALALVCAFTAVPACADSESLPEAPLAVIDPELTGVWRFHDELYGIDLVWTFNEDGTGSYYANDMEMPIRSYVATTEPFTEYEEDGFLITVYYGEITQTFGDTVITTYMEEPVEYGYIVNGDTLRIVFSRDIANHFTDYIRE